MTITADYLDQDTCFMCDRVPLTFDELDRALCARHATISLVAGRIDPELTRGVAEDLVSR